MHKKTCTKCGEVKDATAEFFHRHKAGKYGLRADCKECYKECSKQYYKDNAERIKQYNAQYYKDNAEHIKQYSAQYYKDNPEYSKQQGIQYREDNAEYIKQQGIQYRKDNAERIKQYNAKYHKDNPEYSKQYYKNNRAKCNVNLVRYRAAKLQQTPELTQLEQDRINFIYEVASTMKDFHVDHWKPLNKGGLHHPDNLQILDATLNREKSNKWPLTPEEEIKYKGYRL